MKVKCIQLIDERSRKPMENSPWLTVERVYHVLSIELDISGLLKFRLIGDNGTTPALHDASQFEVVNDLIPSTWVVVSKPGICFELTPKSWTKAGFWENYFDGMREAVALFELERKKMLDEDPTELKN